MIGPIRVFVSSKQGELDIERAIIKQQVKAAGLEPTLAEEWDPSRESMNSVYLSQVEQSAIYVGVFYRVFSAPTVEEYRAALRNPYRDILIYKRECREDLREAALQVFLREVATRHVFRSYERPEELLEMVEGQVRNSMRRMIVQLMRLGANEDLDLAWGSLPTAGECVGGAESASIRDSRRAYLHALGLSDSDIKEKRFSDLIQHLEAIMDHL